MQHVRGRILPGVRLFQLAGKSAYLLLQVDKDGAAVDSLRALGLFARFDHVAAFRHLINRDNADRGRV